MHSNPRTSVVIPARNAGKTLAETLNSLLAQSDPDWEALVIDDGSTDETGDVIKCFSQRDSRFVGLQGQRAGVSAARNIGLSKACGRRVLFLDGDDWIDHCFLDLMNGALDSAPDAVAAYCGDRRVMPDGQQTAPRSNPRIAEAPFEIFARYCAIAIHAVLIERQLIMRIGGFDASLRTCEDWDLWQRASRMGGRWVQVNAPLCYYRASENSLTQDVNQMLADAAIVVSRGFSTDERLPEVDLVHPYGASTLDGDTADLAYSYFALWCAAFECGRGGTGSSAIGSLGNLRSSPDRTRSVVHVLLDGVIAGARGVPAQLAARWPEYGSSITALIAELGRTWDDPVAARRIQYSFERLLLDYDNLSAPRRLSLTLGLRVDSRNRTSVTPPPGVDRLYVYLCDGPKVCALLDLGALGTITSSHWRDLSVSASSVAEVAESESRLLNIKRLRHSLRVAGKAFWAAIRPRSWLSNLSMAPMATGTTSPLPLLESHQKRLRLLRLEAERFAMGAAGNLDNPAGGATINKETAGDVDRFAYWNNIFQEPDPWNYGSAYEQEKYDRQLMLLPARRIDRALELACAEGRFTQKLAPQVEHLLATDISTVALERTRDRCRSHGNVEFRQLDLAVDSMPEELDLIVCSEVLYFLHGEAELKRVARALAAALKPGGHLLTAHAFVLKDDLSHTGFDWENPWGAKTINRVLSAVPGLALERSICTELYRIDRFARLREGEQHELPKIEHLPITAEIEPKVARFIVRAGVQAERPRQRNVPVLSYHRVASNGPVALARYRVSPDMFVAQMKWLRENGYHSINSEELGWFLANGYPFAGRPVVITFDDGYKDFADQAWPILRSHNFKAEVFVVTDLVGQAARWDKHLGEPAPLMDATAIAGLAAEGVTFGSHLASHRAADGLSTYELAEELTRSRATLRQLSGTAIVSFAAPFGLTDERLRRLAAECGYRIGYSTEYGEVTLTSDPFNLPRIEVHGSLTLNDFIALLEGRI